MTPKKLLFIYYITLGFLLLYSFALVDPNITLINLPIWTAFRNIMVQLGYYHRQISTVLYISIISLLSFLHILLVRSKSINPTKLAIATALLLLFSYPFLSHDLFNYMFDARILTFHHANPYLHAALDFPSDQWIRFMHWTHRPYPYGPTFLPLTLIPSFLSGGKFILAYLFFKAMYGLLYVWTVKMLTKMNKTYGIFFATQPLIIIEGLVNNHNDLIAVSFAIMGIYYASSKILSALAFVMSAGIKYITIPAVLLLNTAKHKKKTVQLSFALLVFIILYISYTGEMQQWYFLNLFLFIPIFFTLFKKSYLFFFSILVSYFPFILYGTWDSSALMLKNAIIVIGFTATCILFLLHKNDIPS